MPQSALPTMRGRRGTARSRKNGANALPAAPTFASRRTRTRQPWLWSPDRPTSRSTHLAQQVACRSGALVILVVGTVGVLVGSHHAARAHPAPSNLLAAQRQMTAQVATHASPVDAPTPSPATSTVGVGSTGTVGSAAATASTATSPATINASAVAAGGQAKVAAVSQAPAPAIAPSPAAGPPKGPAKDTIASWYSGRPLECWNGGEPLALPLGIKMWAASRTLPCGTTIEVDGPAGTAILLIEDHGPYLHPGRDLDLSPLAFAKVAGPLAKGVVRVEYQLAPGAAPTP